MSVKLDAEQKNVVRQTVRVGRRVGASPRAIKAALETLATEANYRNPKSATDHDSLGAFQQRPSTGWGSPGQVTNVGHAAKSFFKAAKQNESKYPNAGTLAQSVQRSAFPDRYNEHRGEALQLYRQYAKDNGGGAKGGRTAGTPATVKTTTIPGVDRSSERKQLLSAYVDTRDKPDSLLSLAAGLQGAQDTPATSKSTVVPGTTGKTSGKVGHGVDHAVRKADQIDKINPAYKWGGGHSPGPVKAGLDCSGAVSKVLGIAPRVSGDLAKIGKPGEGKHITIYANGEHTFLKIKDPRTGKVRFFGTSGFGHPEKGTGAAWFTKSPPADYLKRFSVRHLDGQ